MVDLDERLRVTARHATSGLDLCDPSEDGAVLTVGERRPRRRRQLLRASVAVTASAAAVLGVVVWTRSDDTTLVPAAGEGAPTSVGATHSSLAVTDPPSLRLRTALDATLASNRFQVRTVTVVPDPDHGMRSAADRSSSLPGVVGSGEYGDQVWAVDGALVATKWTAGPAAAAGISTIRDTAAGTTWWQVANGVWERATLEEPGLAEQLRSFVDGSCSVRATASDPSTLEVTVAGDDCSEGSAAEPGSVRWMVALRSDGRIDRISPVRDGEPIVDPRSEQVFGYDDVAVTLPNPSTVTEVPTPLGSYIDSATGYARPMYTNG